MGLSFHPGSAKGCNKASTVFKWRWSYSSNCKEENAYSEVSKWMEKKHVLRSTAHHPMQLPGEAQPPVHTQCKLTACASAELHGGPWSSLLYKGFLNWRTHLSPEQKDRHTLLDLSITVPSQVSASYITNCESTDLVAKHNSAYLAANLHKNWYF